MYNKFFKNLILKKFISMKKNFSTKNEMENQFRLSFLIICSTKLVHQLLKKNAINDKVKLF